MLIEGDTILLVSKCAFRDRFILMSPTPTIVLLFSFSTTNGRIFQPIYFYRGWWICGPNNNKHK